MTTEARDEYHLLQARLEAIKRIKRAVKAVRQQFSSVAA